MATIAPATALRIRQIRAQLPPEAFRPARERLWQLPLHGALIAAGYVAIRRWPASGPFVAALIGHSLACLAFLAHEISHNAVIRTRGIKYTLELATLMLNIIPPTMWNRLHNDSHHGHTNTIRDPDRPFVESEETTVTNAYSAMTMPARETSRVNILVFTHFVTYVARHIAAVFYSGDAKPGILTSKPAYRPSERRTILAELVVIAAGQFGVWLLVGRSWTDYMWASPIALCCASAVVMSYVFTNHFLNPISHEHDPLTGTTSVRVPRVFDRLHSNFSFHTEHHLFPSLNSDYYPLVSEALKELAPEDYRQLPITDAWRQLWLQPRFRTVETRASNPSAPRRP